MMNVNGQLLPVSILKVYLSDVAGVELDKLPAKLGLKNNKEVIEFLIMSAAATDLAEDTKKHKYAPESKL